MTETELRNSVALIMEEWARSGKVYEWSRELQCMIERYNQYPDIGRGIAYKPSLGGWCALGVSVAFMDADLADLIQPEIGAYEMEKWAKDSRFFRGRDSGYVPKRGDLIHYAFPRSTETGKVYTQFHVGLVTNCDENILFSTECNVQSRCVMREMREWQYNDIVTGFTEVPYYKKASLITIEVPPIPDKTGTYLLGALNTGKSKEITWIKQ